MSRIVTNRFFISTQTPLRRATQDPFTQEIIEEPISLTKEQLSSYADLELTRLQEAVVRIGCYMNGLSIYGSAVIISPDGLAVTNKHVAEALFAFEGLTVKVTQPTDFSSGSYDRQKIISLIRILNNNEIIPKNFLTESLLFLVKDKNFFRKLSADFSVDKKQEVDTNEFTAELLNIDPISDLALIRINKNDPEHNFSFVSFEEGEVTLRAGDESYTLGHPFGTNFNVLRRGEVLKPIDEISRSIVNARMRLNSQRIPDLTSIQNFQLEGSKGHLLIDLINNAKESGTSLALNTFMAGGDSGGLQANPKGQLRGINSALYNYSQGELATLGLRPHNLSTLKMLSVAVPAQRVLDFSAKAGVNINSLLRGQEVGVSKMSKAKPPKNSKPK